MSGGFGNDDISLIVVDVDDHQFNKIDDVLASEDALVGLVSQPLNVGVLMVREDGDDVELNHIRLHGIIDPSVQWQNYDISNIRLELGMNHMHTVEDVYTVVNIDDMPTHGYITLPLDMSDQESADEGVSGFSSPQAEARQAAVVQR